MACDSVPQEPPPPPWHAAAAGAPEQLLLDAPARERRRRRRALLADEEEKEQADAVHHGVAAGHAIAPTAEGSSEETTTGPATALLLPSEVVGSFSKGPSPPSPIYLCRSVSSSTQRNVWLLLKNGAGNFQGKIRDLTPLHSAAAKRSYKALQGSSEETAVLDTVMLLPLSAAVGNFSKGTLSTQEPRVQVISSVDKSAVDLLSYLQDPKAVRLLAEKTSEIWEVPCEDDVDECVTALAMLLLLVEEKISAPVSVVVDSISTKRSCCNVTIMLQLSGSSRTGLLLLKNMGTIFAGCFPFSVDSAEFGLVEKSILTGLKRGSQFQIRSIIFVQLEGGEGIVDARYQMLGKRMDVNGAVAGPYLPAELQRTASWRQFIHQWTKANCNMLDGELCEKHNIHKWCTLLVQCLPSWFLMSGNWLPGFLVGETEKHKERYPLNDLESDSGATYAVELGHGVHGYDNPRHPMHFLPGVPRICVVPGRNGPATNAVHLPLLSEPKSELAESSDYRYPVSPLIANITGDSHDTESQQLDPCSESSNVASQQGSECRLTNVDSHHIGHSADNDSLVIPIFVRHFSRELTFTVSLDQSSQHLMHLYAQNTKTKLECQYFVYGRKTLEPDHTLRFYGLKRDTTVHVCTRLLGGKPPTLEKYVNDNKKKFTVEVPLPDGEISLQMTIEGCQFLSSWIKCFTTAFSRGMSWKGKFELNHFKCVDGHIRIIKEPKGNCPSGSMADDLIKFVGHVEDILRSNKPYLISKYPPYLEHFRTFVNNDLLPRLTVTNALSSEDKLFLETHVCCMTCNARERLIIDLFRKYEGRDANKASDWQKAIDGASCYNDWVSDLPPKSLFFNYAIEKAKGKGVHYNKSRTSAFIFIKDIVLHATDSHTGNSKAPNLNAVELAQGVPPQLGEGIELMIPAYLENFLPTIILKLIKEKVDISAELLAAIECACRLCGSSH